MSGASALSQVSAQTGLSLYEKNQFHFFIERADLFSFRFITDETFIHDCFFIFDIVEVTFRKRIANEQKRERNKAEKK
jgi:hypothetical protein